MHHRNAIWEDLPEIVAIYNSTIPGRMVTADTEPVTVASKMEWFRKHDPEIRPIWMIYNEEHELIGWASFSDFYGRPAYSGTSEISIYLDEKFRGQGWGKRILKLAIEKSVQFHLHTLLGFIFGNNIPSIQLFLSEGFEVWGRLPSVALLDDNYIDLIIVGLKIGTSPILTT